MFRNSILALVVALGVAVGWSDAQLPTIRMPTTRMPTVPLQRPAQGSELQGNWYQNGNPNQVARFEITPREGRIRQALLTSPTGQQSNARLYWRGNVIVAPGWGLRGRFNNNTIRWSNGVYWTR